MNTFLYKGGDISYSIVGEGKPIIFIHGFALDSRMWKPQVEELSKDHKVVIYDLRGFGKSSIPREPYSHYDDLYVLLKYLDIEKAHIVGHSFGGEVAIDFTLEYPELVDKLTLISSSLGGYQKENIFFNDLMMLGNEGRLDELKDRILNHEMFESLKNNSKVYNQVTDIVDNYSCWHFINNDPVKRLNPSAKDRLNEIEIPVNIIVGEDDLHIQKEIADKLDKDINNSKLNIISNTGHMVNLEKPYEVNECLKEK